MFGYFDGDVVARWLRDCEQPDRDMQLIQDFAYVDPDGRRWEAGHGRCINGASIPGALWSTVGCPYVGDYRRATVIHDIACEDETSTSDAVHLMFYYAMRCDGVSAFRANLMYQSVKRFGPQWGMREGPEVVREMSSQDVMTLSLAVQLALDELGEGADVADIDRRVGEILTNG